MKNESFNVEESEMSRVKLGLQHL